MTFEPIAIVGRACQLPGASTPDALWNAVSERRDLITNAPADRWGLSPREVSGTPDAATDRTWSERGGYVADDGFDAAGYAVSADALEPLDPLFHWLLRTGRDALREAGLSGSDLHRAGAVVGNLSFPTSGMARQAERAWLGDALADAAGLPATDPRDRFMSGYPAHLLAQALGLGGSAFCLDAACASSLVAIKIACDRLHARDADVMLAGAVSRADDLFIHIGFCALNAMSKSGQSRPFHRDADGLVPAEGAGFVALMRLSDAERQGRAILGVIRGVGLSNDGRSGGLLAPSQAGQVRAMADAYAASGWAPADVDYVECHATGTPTGDRTELLSMAEVFGQGRSLPIGSLKSNLGHLITAAGVAGLLKVLSAFEHGTLPPTRLADDAPRNETLEDAPFRIVTEPEPWPEDDARPRRAAISAFGFGGNNAHLLVEAYRPGTTSEHAPKPREAVAVVGVAVRRPENGEVELPISALRFPPRDLEQTLPQQLLLWRAALDAIAGLELPAERTGVVVGMGCDPNIARYGARWRMPSWARRWNVFDEAWVDAAQATFTPSLQAAGVLGTMPNIVANRINAALGFGGASLSVSGEEVSGLRALTVALDGLNAGELDAAVVGAVDLSRDPVHEDALRAVVGKVDLPADDVAVVLVLQRESDALAAGHPIIARIDDLADEEARVVPRGGAHAAQALLAVAEAITAGGSHRLVAHALGHQRGHARISGGAASVPNPSEARDAKTLAFPAHLRPVALPPWPKRREDAVAAPYQPDPNAVTELQRAPELEPIAAPAPPVAPMAMPQARRAAPVGAAPTAATTAVAAAPRAAASPSGVAGVLVAQRRRLAATHQQFLAQQAAIHQQFLDARSAAQQQWTGLSARGAIAPVRPAPPVPVAPPPAATPPQAPTAPAAPAPTASPAPPAPKPELPGFKLDRDGLMVHAGGNISEIYGGMFEPQDAYHRVTRMPLPPLLLADRMTGIDAEPGVLGTGTIWTETDIEDDSWYLHDGRMPGGLMIESGQADLMLISYMGVDLLNKGDRIYRLLGCELTYHGSLPKPGETLAYDIHIDGHAAQGDVRLFFFHYDCHVGDERRLSVRGGQAGYFTDEELADSAGILWKPETGERCENPRLDTPPQVSEHRSFSNAQLRAFSERRTFECFGKGFEKTCPHTRTPAIAGGRMLFVEEVTDFDPQGGPWKRGYLRAVDTIEPDDWFFEGHFHNDPCMPGTLMFEGCLQTMAIYLTALGFTIERDGWRFEPVPEEKYLMRCRGQVTPTSKELIYEVFIEEVIDGDTPTIFADLLCTVDGLGAFHCRRMGLRLVPDWPMDALLEKDPSLLSRAPGEVAEVNGFRFDHDSLLACAWGRPSRAFGPMYEVFDSHRKVARLPGPPYHFMTRIAKIDSIPGGMQPGGEIEVEYDIPQDAWYFDDNGARTMPFAVLLEAALQPCGWLASFVGSALTSDIDLAFRNLDGTGTLHAELFPSSGTLRTRSKIVSISSSAGMIIESFEVQCFLGDTLVYEMDTVFGFFPKEALDAQVGLPVPEYDADVLSAPCDVEPVDLKSQSQDTLFRGSCRLASPFLMMIDRVTGIWPEGGAAGLGKYRAEKDVDPGEWFFKAHFFQDPVQPGSLGIEAMVQLLQFAMLDQGMDEGIEDARFESLGLGTPLTWKYRGQVRTHNDLVHCVVELTETGRDERGAYAIATASLWVDGMRIYEAKGLGMRIVSGGAPTDDGRGRPDGEEIIEPDGWLADHCPTFTVPALPMMSMVDRLAGAAKALHPRHEVVALDDVQVERWLPVDKPVRLRTEVGERDGDRIPVTLSAWREAPRAELSRFEPVARGVVTLAPRYPDPSEVALLPPLEDAQTVASPYEDGALFHGPAFHKLLSLSRSKGGASAVLDAAAGAVPLGTLNQVLLDAATHPIPHDALHVFSEEIRADQVAYPYRIPRVRFYGPVPTAGEVRCEVRFVGFDGDFRFPAFEVQLQHQGRVWCAFRLVEILLPKGPLGTAPPADRRAFLRDRQPVKGLALSQTESDATRVSAEQVKASNWLPGTVEAIYALDPEEDTVTQVAVKDHIARVADVHPSTVRMLSDERGFSAVSAAQPLTRHPLALQRQDGVSVRSSAPVVDLAPVRSYWDEYFGIGSWPVEDLYYSLIERFVRRVHVSSPEAFDAIRGRGILYLANHQVAIESLLFSIIASGLNHAPTVTLAKAEHRTTWLGKLIQHCFSYPGITDPKVITYFDRSDPTSLPMLIDELARDMAVNGKSVMVHVEGTRSLSCREPVVKMTSKFVDMSLATRCPVVPVRFAGALPVEPLDERIEFPIGHGQQDIYFGAPIFPEDFEALPYKDRKHLVIDGINALGPNNADEEPFPGDPELAAKVAAREKATEASPEHATLFEVLAERDDLGVDAQRLIDSFRGGIVLDDDERGYWTAELARRLYGAKGPSVTIR